MVDWQITATTIYCDAVADEVTLLVYKDGTAKCTGYAKYSKPEQETKAALDKKAGQLEQNLKCQGLKCPRIVQYRDGLLAMEEGGE